VHAVEIDPDVLPALREAVGGLDNVRIHEGDALRFDYSALDPAPNKLVANLPYNVASPLVLRLLEEVESLETLRFMVQLEVARRMAAERGTKDYGAYAVLAQLLARVGILHRVPPTVFDPPPRVHSAVVEMDRKQPPKDYYRLKASCSGRSGAAASGSSTTCPSPRGRVPHEFSIPLGTGRTRGPRNWHRKTSWRYTKLCRGHCDEEDPAQGFRQGQLRA
jgi:16S rRNA (adenine1518-N6/adenine1519-N6)-dimethyltransferase